MTDPALKDFAKKTFAVADVVIDGNRPWDIHVNDDRFYESVVNQGSLGFGESYMNGWFDVAQLDECVNRILQAPIDITAKQKWMLALFYLNSLIFNKQSKSRALEVGRQHYDLGNDLFECMLDKRMVYSCGYWRNAKNLDEAQEAKLDLVCRKLMLQPGMKVLDIGCGWGSFAKFAAEKYGVHVVGITISQQQLQLAQELCKGLSVELKFQDYRDIHDTYDRIVSIGQMEHVGYKNYGNYMKIVAQSLSEDGLFLLHTIGSNRTTTKGDPWMEKYIFPNGMLPSIVQLAKASEGLFVMEDWHNFGADYDKTLLAWYQNFENNWDKLKAKYDERFHRMWRYYLLSCAGTFRSRSTQLWQIVYSKKGVKGGYLSIR